MQLLDIMLTKLNTESNKSVYKAGLKGRFYCLKHQSAADSKTKKRLGKRTKPVYFCGYTRYNVTDLKEEATTMKKALIRLLAAVCSVAAMTPTATPIAAQVNGGGP